MSFLYDNFIADFFRMLLEFLYENLVPNYIVIVLLFIILLKVVLSPLDIKQRESGRKMTKLQPKIADIKKRYQDPMTQNKKMQELYKKENVKMTAGCLPAIVSLVVLIAFFGALQQISYIQTIEIVKQAAENPGVAVELEGFLWVRNIWQADSGSALVMPTLEEWTRILDSVGPEIADTVRHIDYNAVMQPTFDAYSGLANGWYILPLIQGVTMYFSMGYSMSLSGGGGENNPMSGPIFKLIMAGMTAWFCLTANVVFVLYWIATNFIMVLQTYLFKRYFDYKDKKALVN